MNAIPWAGLAGYAILILVGYVCYIAGRTAEQRQHERELRRLGRHIDRQIHEHREAMRTLPR